MRGQVFCVSCLKDSEDKTYNTDDKTEIHDGDASQRAAEDIEAYLCEVRQDDVRFAGKGRGSKEDHGRQGQYRAEKIF